MKDGHIHIHDQEYNLELIENMVKVALDKGIDEINVLDHSHKFKEFAFLYSTLKDETTISWYKKKNPIDISIYLDFIKLVKSHSWPIKINFGLEICYFPTHREELKDTLDKLPKFDFLIGSIHFVDEIGIDIDESIFALYDVDTLWKDYFLHVEDSIKSQLFDIIGHPDEIKLMAPSPSFSLLSYYEHLAKTLKEYNQVTENNSGLIRRGFPYPGLDPILLDTFIKYDVKFVKSSDAHRYQDIGRVFDQIIDNL